jgi:site-specific DNA-methyltransferase (adenine-specific)
MMLERTCSLQRNVAQRGDALELLRALSDACSPLVFFDPQHRGVLDKLAFGNEGARQQGRTLLPAMTESYIDAVCIEIARVLKPSGAPMRWLDTFGLVEARVARELLVGVDLIAWDNQRMGMGKRSRRRGDYLLVLQKPPVRCGNTWTDHGIPSRWTEKVERSLLHPHIKSVELITRLIAATTAPGNLVVDPAAGSFAVMQAAHSLGRQFIGCDIAYSAKHRQAEWDPERKRSSLASLGNELAGETGELCNALKKAERELLGLPGSRVTVGEIADEIADVIIVADLMLPSSTSISLKPSSRNSTKPARNTASKHAWLRSSGRMASFAASRTSPRIHDGHCPHGAGCVRLEESHEASPS